MYITLLYIDAHLVFYQLLTFLIYLTYFTIDQLQIPKLPRLSFTLTPGHQAVLIIAILCLNFWPITTQAIFWHNWNMSCDIVTHVMSPLSKLHVSSVSYTTFSWWKNPFLVFSFPAFLLHLRERGKDRWQEWTGIGRGRKTTMGLGQRSTLCSQMQSWCWESGEQPCSGSPHWRSKEWVQEHDVILS